MPRFAWVAMAVLASGAWAGNAAGASFPAPVTCLDSEDAFQTAVVGRPAVQGGELEVLVTRRAAFEDVSIGGLAVKVAGSGPTELIVPSVDEESATPIAVPARRSFVVSIAWTQGPSPIEPYGCIGIDRHRVRAVVAGDELRRYLGRVGRVQAHWTAAALAYGRCVDGVVASSPASVLAAASCLDAARRRDRSQRLYRRIPAPPGLEKAHRGLVRSAAIRARTATIGASALRRVALVLQARSLDVPDPVFPAGLQRHRALWRTAVIAEAKPTGTRIPPYVRKVGR